MIIDTHVHIGESLGFCLTPDDVIYSMKTYGIDYSLVSSVSAAEFDHELNPLPLDEQKSQIDCLQECLEFAKTYPGRIGVAVWVKPHTETVTDELKSIIAENIDIIKAVKVHPYHSKTAFDSEKMNPFFELARSFSLPVVIHTGGCDEASPVRVYNAAKVNRDIDFVMVHMGLGTDNQEAIDLICRLPNLYGDTAWVPVKSTLQLINRSSSHKIMFGSDNPIDGKDTYLHNRTDDRSLYQEYFNELKSLLTKEDYENLMWKTAAELFRIDTSSIPTDWN